MLLTLIISYWLFLGIIAALLINKKSYLLVSRSSVYLKDNMVTRGLDKLTSVDKEFLNIELVISDSLYKHDLFLQSYLFRLYFILIRVLFWPVALIQCDKWHRAIICVERHVKCIEIENLANQTYFTLQPGNVPRKCYPEDIYRGHRISSNIYSITTNFSKASDIKSARSTLHYRLTQSFPTAVTLEQSLNSISGNLLYSVIFIYTTGTTGVTLHPVRIVIDEIIPRMKCAIAFYFGIFCGDLPNNWNQISTDIIFRPDQGLIERFETQYRILQLVKTQDIFQKRFLFASLSK